MKLFKELIATTLIYSMLIGSVVIPETAYAKSKSNRKCYTGIDDCKKHKIDPYKISGDEFDAAGYCKSLGNNQKACTTISYLAVAYTAMTAVCGTVCALKATGYGITVAQALEPVCTYGSLAVSAADLLASNKLKKSMGEYSDAVAENMMKTTGVSAQTGKMLSIGFSGVTLLANAGKLGTTQIAQTATKALTFGAKKTTEEASKKAISGACISAVFNGVYATTNYVNRKRVITNSKDNLASVQQVWPTQGLVQNDPTKQNGLGTVTSSTASAPPISDERNNSTDLGDGDDMSKSKVASSYATAGNGKLLGDTSADKMHAALDALEKHMGVTPEMLNDSIDANGVGGTLSKLLGGSEGGKILGDAFKEMEAKAGEGDLGLAYDSTSSSSSGASSKPASDPFGDLLGNRGPATADAGGLKEIQFSGFNGDIWHTGTNLSIFEIVSRKTKSVSTRVGR